MAGQQKLLTPGGGGVLLTPAASIASDKTVQIPAQDCTLGIQGPAFSATASGTVNATTSTWTKVTFPTKEFDTNNCFDNVTNYRFTPTVAGYYQINAEIYFQSNATGATYIRLYKNGSSFKDGLFVTNNNQGASPNLSVLVYANGSTDYFEIYGWQNSGVTLTVGGNYFQASLVRGA